MGHTVFVINSPIAKGMFYWLILGERKEDAISRGIMSVLVPFVGTVSGAFTPVNMVIEEDDIAGWEAISPVSLAKTFSSPFVLIHYTSDILVPLAQITRKYAYSEDGDSVPKGVSTKMNSNNLGVLGKESAGGNLSLVYTGMVAEGSLNGPLSKTVCVMYPAIDLRWTAENARYLINDIFRESLKLTLAVILRIIRIE
jgi:hypothetical protein